MQSIVEVRGEEGCGEGGPVRPFAGGVAEFEVGEGGIPVGRECVGEGEAVPVEHDVVDELVDGELGALGGAHSSEPEDHAVYRRRQLQGKALSPLETPRNKGGGGGGG